MELSLSNGLILYVDEVRQTSDIVYILRHGKEIGRWYKADMNQWDTEAIMDLI